MSAIRDAAASSVHTGFWIDHDKGRFITLTDKNAAALISVLAVAVTFAANRSWKLFRFTLYRCHFSGENNVHRTPKSTRELQVVLRNVITAGSTIWTCLELLWTRRQAPRSLESTGRVQVATQHHRNWRSLTLALIAVVHFIVFIAAGIFTSRVLIGSEVISRNTTSCGSWQPILSDDLEPQVQLAQQLLYQSVLLNDTLDADNYVRNCYELGVSRGLFDCGKLHLRSLPYQTEHDVKCPFGDNLCSERPDGAFAMDSGRITFGDLGINSKFGKDLSFQRHSTCAVVPEEPFLAGKTSRLNSTDSSRTYVFYGTEIQNGYAYANDVSSGTFSLRATHLAYPAYPPEMIAEPLRPSGLDHDPSILLLRSNGVKFFSESDDPWFSVHTKDNTTAGLGTTMYNTDNFLNIIACKESVRYCSSLTNNCTPWNGVFSALINITDAILTLGGPGTTKGSSDYNEMLDVFSLVGMAATSTPLPNSIQNRPATSALQSVRYLADVIQFHLEPEQWKLELEYWFAVAMARMQLEIFNTIEKAPAIDESFMYNTWNGTGLQRLCGRVKFHSSGHTTLSAVGIFVIVAIVVVLTVISLVDVFLMWFPFKWAKHVVEEWEKLENLELLNELEEWSEKKEEEAGEGAPLQIRVETK